MVERTIAWTGRIDTAIANAGIMVEGDILSVSLDDWQRAIAVNTTGTFLTARKVLPYLIEGGGGTLVFTASTVGLVGMKGTAAYSASKGAIVALTRQLPRITPIGACGSMRLHRAPFERLCLNHNFARAHRMRANLRERLKK